LLAINMFLSKVINLFIARKYGYCQCMYTRHMRRRIHEDTRHMRRRIHVVIANACIDLYKVRRALQTSRYII
jgi:hypothetical protein